MKLRGMDLMIDDLMLLTDGLGITVWLDLFLISVHWRC